MIDLMQDFKHFKARSGVQCKGQNIFVMFDEHVISLGGLVYIVNKLCEQYSAKSFQNLKAQFMTLIEKISRTFEVRTLGLTGAETVTIKKALLDYNGPLFVYFLASNQKILTSNEVIQLYKTKVELADPDRKEAYKLKLSCIINLMDVFKELDDFLVAFKKYLALESQVEERRIRGLDLSINQRIKRNVGFLKTGKFEEEITEITEMTLGRYYETPGMLQSHAVLAVDTLTGAIFTPQEIQRFASFIHAEYQQKEKDATTLDFIYAFQNPNREKIIELPKGYEILPLRFMIELGDLSAEAKEVIKTTESLLFSEVLHHLESITKRKMNPAVIKWANKMIDEGFFKKD